MGRRGGWFSAIKRALIPEPREKKDQRSQKSKRRWFSRHYSDQVSSNEESALTISAPPPAPLIEDVKLNEIETQQSKHAYSVALATAVAAEAAVAAAQAAAEVVRLTSVARFSGKTKEEIAAIRIQTAFRGYMARRALRALRGLVRLKTLIQGQSVKRQAATTLRCMQTLARVQSQIRARRIRMSEENKALQKLLQQKREKEIEKLKLGDDWNDSPRSKEQLEARLINKQEAAMRRERALAYAFSHQQAMKSKSTNPTFMDPNNPTWGWSWLERWMAARPWETRATVDYTDRASVKSLTNRAMPAFGEINRSYSARPSPTSSHNKPSRIHHSPSTPASRAPSISSVTGKARTFSPKATEDDNRSSFSMQSEQHYRRHSIGGSSIRDDESLASSPSVPSYMTPTKSTRARSYRSPSPLGSEKKDKALERGSGGSSSTKKRLSFSESPVGARRLSGPPKIDSASIKEIVGNGGRRVR